MPWAVWNSLRPSPLVAEVRQVLAGLVELEDVIAGVAVGEEDVAVGGDGDRGGVELLEVEARLLRERQLQDDLAGLGAELDPLGRLALRAP